MRCLQLIVAAFAVAILISPKADAQSKNLSKLNKQVAELYRAGKFVDATKMAQRALELAEKTLGSEHPGVAEALNDLAVLYKTQGLFADSAPLYKRSLEIRGKALGGDHPDVAESLNNLAGLYFSLGQYADAEPLLKRSLTVYEKSLGGDHPRAGATLNNLAELYRTQGRTAEAEPLYKRSLAIAEHVLGPVHPAVALSLNNLAVLYGKQGRYAEAEALFMRSLTIREKALGGDHSDVGTSLTNLAALSFVQRDWASAADYFKRGAAVIVRRARRGSSIIGRSLTGKKKSEASQNKGAFWIYLKAAYRFQRQRRLPHDKLTNDMFLVAQWASGSEAAASLAKMAARQVTGNDDLAKLVRKRQDFVSEWQKRDAWRSAGVAQSPSKRNRAQEALNVARITAIDRRIAEIDKRLAADFPNYAAHANPEPLSITDVQAQLKSNEALILFLDTPEWKPTQEETFVWVVTKTTSRWVRSDVGTRTLRDHVDALRCGLDFAGAWKGSRCFDLLNVVFTEEDYRARKQLPFRLNRAHALYKSLFGQIEDLITGKDLLVVPSGPLTQLPFQVLVTEKPKQDQLTREAFRAASWLAKRHVITVLPSVTSLAALRAHAKASKARQPFVGFGNPLLDGDKQDPWHQDAAKLARAIQGCAGSNAVRTAQLRVARRAVMPMGRGTRLADLAQLRAAAALPETADELCVVGRSAGARNDDIYLGRKATEQSIKALSDAGTLANYKVLHFATHGALAGELKGSNEPGLILSPPPTATKKDDGYLSASEVAGLKLDADWVILSACNTAGGETKNAEALSGLAKAFFYAGARSLLVSHWYVDSQATVGLITKAFNALKRDPKIGRAGALRWAMLSLINEGQRTWHPAYWAPFVVVGEGGSTGRPAGQTTNLPPVPIGMPSLRGRRRPPSEAIRTSR